MIAINILSASKILFELNGIIIHEIDMLGALDISLSDDMYEIFNELICYCETKKICHEIDDHKYFYGANYHKYFSFLIKSLKTSNFRIAQLLISIDGLPKNIPRDIYKYTVELIEFMIHNGMKLQDILEYKNIDNNSEVVRYLLQNGIELSNIINSLYKFDIGIVDILLTNNCFNASEILEYPQINSDIQLIEYLLSNGADINTKESILLYRAVNSYKYDTVEYLISNGADIDLALITACKCKSVNTIRYLVDIGAKINKEKIIDTFSSEGCYFDSRCHVIDNYEIGIYLAETFDFIDINDFVNNLDDFENKIFDAVVEMDLNQLDKDILLLFGIGNQNIKLVNYLIRNGANYKNTIKSLVELVISKDDGSLLQYLSTNNDDMRVTLVNKDILFTSVDKLKSNIFEVLLDNGIDVDAVGCYGRMNLVEYIMYYEDAGSNYYIKKCGQIIKILRCLIEKRYNSQIVRKNRGRLCFFMKTYGYNYDEIIIDSVFDISSLFDLQIV